MINPRHNILIFLSVACAIANLSIVAASEVQSYSYSGILERIGYVTEVKDNILPESSVLEVGSEEPPIGSRSAAHIATRALREKFGDAVKHLTVSSVSLQCLGKTNKWFWAVSFDDITRLSTMHSSDRLTVGVLLDQAVILPERETPVGK